MHNQVGARNASVDFLDAVDGENITCRWAAEFVRAVAGAAGDSQRIDAGFSRQSRLLLQGL